MPLPDHDKKGARGQGVDVFAPQRANLPLIRCAAKRGCAKVTCGLSQAAVTSRWGSSGDALPGTALQEHRRLECLRARAFCLPFALSPSRRPVHRKLKKLLWLKNRFQPNRLRPASTNDLSGRGAIRHFALLPAAPVRGRPRMSIIVTVITVIMQRLSLWHWHAGLQSSSPSLSLRVPCYKAGTSIMRRGFRPR